MELSPQILKGSTHSSRKPTRGSDPGGHKLEPSCVHGVDVPVASPWVPSVMGGHGWGQRGSGGG